MIDYSSNHEKIIDKRGHIRDLFLETEIKAVTEILSEKESVRANHYHNDTEQYNYVAYGSLTLAVRKNYDSEIIYHHFNEGSAFLIEKKEHHAIKFLEKTLLIVFTIGPRAGKEYESDTYRLEKSLFN